jgi:hypothetical protein
MENLDLNNYAGETVTFQFRFTSEGSVTSDGFFVDDFFVE